MRRLTYVNSRGESIEFYLSPLLIESLEGIGEVDADLQSQNAPYLDGDIPVETMLQPRFIDLEGSILKTELKEIKSYRKEILRVCNPKLGIGTLTLELDGDIKEIPAQLDGVPEFPERAQDVWQKYLISWKCPNPYWRDLNQTSKPLQSYVGNFKLPTTFPIKLGVAGSRTELDNLGDVPSPVLIEVRGPTTNPQIHNRTTGKFIKIERSIAQDEVMMINTEPGNKSIIIQRGDGTTEQAFGYLDDGSDMFDLDIGINVIEHVADAGNSKSKVIVTWQSRYVGI